MLENPNPSPRTPLRACVQPSVQILLLPSTMPPRVAKKGAVKKTPPPKLKKAEVPAELEEVPVETPADEAPVDTIVEEKVAVEEDVSAAETAEEVEAAEEAVQEVDGSEEEDSGEDDAMNDVEDDAEDGEGGMQAENGKQEDDNPLDIKVKLEEREDENVDNPEIEGDTHDGDGAESDNEEHDDNEEDPSAFLPTSPEEIRKQKGEIFVGGLSKKATEDDLIKVFSVVGEVQAARVARSLSSNKSRGFAFIQYATIEHAKKALADLKDGVEVLGKRVTVSASTANDTLYVGNICKTWTSDQVLETLKNLGVEHINEMLLPNDPTSEGKNKGFAFLDFSSHVAAMAAFQRLKSPDAYFGRDKSAKVAFAHSMRHVNVETPSKVKTVYVEGLSPSWDDEKLKDLGKAYGEVESVEVVRRAGRNKRKEFGFIGFSSHESALACVEGINKAEVAEGESKMTANLARFERKRRHPHTEQNVDRGGAENSDVAENKNKKSNLNVKNAKAKKQTKTGNKVAQEHKKVPEHSGGKKRKGKMDSDFRGPQPKRQHGDWGAGNIRHRTSRYATAGTGRASHSSDLEPHAGLLPSGRHGGHIPARRSHNQPDVFAAHGGGHADPYSYPGYANYPGYRNPHPYGGSAQYPPRRAYY